MYPTHPEGVMPLTAADHICYSMQAYERCLNSLDELNRLIEHTYRCVQDDPTNMKYQTRYHGLCILRDVDNEEAGA
jgi:hypothetical protein